MAKLRINGDSSGYVDLEAPNAASSSTLDLDQVPQMDQVNNFTENVGINRSTPQSKFEVWTGNGELSHFGSNNANANNNYTGITLGYAESGANSNYRKVGIVAVGRGDGAARQDLAFLVDSNADGNSVDLGDTKMRISHEGYVTTPYQPSFYAYPQGGGIASTNGYTTPGLDNTSYNIGNHWNTSTATFTAPTAGYYYFKFAVYWNSTNGYSRLRIEKNGTDINHYNIKPGLGGDHSQEVSGIVSMSANDTIKPQVQSDQSNSYFRAKNHTYFEGYLIG